MADPDRVVDVNNRRNPITFGGNPINFLELTGAHMIEVTAFEPDPCTCREDYYYNAVHNRLYRRIVTHRRNDGVIKAQWVPYSD